MERGAGGVAGVHEVLEPGLGKTRVKKKKKTAQWVFWVFLGNFFFICIFAQKREF
jgi:hypothetical protein